MTPAELRERREAMVRQDEADLRAILGTPSGRRFIGHLVIGRCGTERPSINQDPYSTAYQEGRRAIGLELSAECESVAFADWAKVLTEAIVRREEDRQLAAQVEPRR